MVLYAFKIFIPLNAYMYMYMYAFKVFIPYQDNTTPLFMASQEGHQDVVQSLLGAGADVNTATSDVSNFIFVE